MLPSVVEDNASLVNDFRACLVDATCFRLALFSSCSHNYACCQCRERECAPQHCAMPINKVVKGHLWRHSHSPKGDSASVSRTHKGLKYIYIAGHSEAWNEWHLLLDMCLYFGSTDTPLQTFPVTFYFLMFSMIRCNPFQMINRNIQCWANPLYGFFFGWLGGGVPEWNALIAFLRLEPVAVMHL